MRILVTAATKFEIEPFLAGNPRRDILITGVGVPATLYQLQKTIYQQRFDFIIQAGIAGSFGDAVPLAGVVMVGRDLFADIGMEEKEQFTPLAQSPFSDKNAFPYKDGWLINPGPASREPLLPVVNAITVNKVSDSLLQQQQFLIAYSPDIETMEGAALHYVCLQENIPFVQIRSVSNTVGERDKARWKMTEAIVNLNHQLKTVVTHLRETAG